VAVDGWIMVSISSRIMVLPLKDHTLIMPEITPVVEVMENSEFQDLVMFKVEIVTNLLVLLNNNQSQLPLMPHVSNFTVEVFLIVETVD